MFENLSPKPLKHAEASEKREQKKSTFELLTETLALVSKRVSESVERECGIKNLIDESGRIRMNGYVLENGGIYEQESVNDDQETVDALDRYNSAADDPKVREYHRLQFGIETPEEIVNFSLKKKEKSRSNQTEMAMTMLMHKFLGERFLVVRASVFDDYKHGVDNLIVDRRANVNARITARFTEIDEKKA